MRAGGDVHGYQLLEDFRVVGAGLSEWTFAQRGGRQYFIKRFLSPTYPDFAAPGSERTKERKRARCAAFEAHHRGIQAALAPVTSYGGNLIATLDFFRVGAKYYKVTEKVDIAGLDIPAIASLDFATRLVLLKTVAHSLKILHDLDIVHSDLKPSNVLVKRTELGYTTKLIDFDSSYIVGSPPPPDEIVGTLNYYSPEFVQYIQGGGVAGALTQASDIFALGLIYTEYLTGAPPPFSPHHHEPAVAVLNGETLRVTAVGLPVTLVALVERMMAASPGARPTIAQVHSALMGLGASGATRAEVIGLVRSPRPAARPPGTSRLRGRGLPGSGPPGGTGSPRPASGARDSPSTPPAAAPSRSSALVGKLLDRLDRRSR